MYLEVYVDVLFLVNFIMDLIILKLTLVILKLKHKNLRMCLSAFVGAFMSCIMALIPKMTLGVGMLLMYILIPTIMIIILVGIKNKKLILNGIIIFAASTFIVGGIFNWLYSNTFMGTYVAMFFNGTLLQKVSLGSLILFGIAVFLAVYFSVKVIRTFIVKNEICYEVKLQYKNSVIQSIGLLDTGNSLKDPYTKRPVIIVELEVVKELLSSESIRYINEFYCSSTNDIPDTLYGDVLFRMIPYQSVGKENGILLSIDLDSIIIEETKPIKVEKVTAAIYDKKLSCDESYHVILHKDLF